MPKKLRGQLILFFLVIQVISMLLANGYTVIFTEQYVGRQIRDALHEHRLLSLSIAQKTTLPAAEIAKIISSSSYHMEIVQLGRVPEFTSEQAATLAKGESVTINTRSNTIAYFMLRGKLVALRPMSYSSLSGDMIQGIFFNNMFIALVAFALLSAFSKRIVKPITRLTQATRLVADGDFDVHVTLGTSRTLFKPAEELQELTQHFNHMTHELKGNEYLRRDFTSNVSHEMKTPVATIAGYANMLKNPDITEEEHREYIDAIEQEVQNMAVLSDNLLKLSKLESINIPAPKNDFALDEQLRQILGALYGEIEKKGITLQVHLQKAHLRGDEDLLRQVWQNLLGNAIKFTPEGGEISVEMQSSSAEITVHIADNGMGMDEFTLKRIYEKFYQADSSHHSGGHGLGLALVHRIVEVSGGRIRVQSEPGKGSRFSVTLPR